MNLGLVGTYAAGKDVVAEIMGRRGFTHFSLSDALRDRMREKSIKLSRENQIKFANNLRAEERNSILAEDVFKKIENSNHNIITSIRNLGELIYLKDNLKNFFLIWIDAPVKVRYKRVLERKESRDFLDFNEFLKWEKKEMYGKGSEQQLLKIKEKADAVLINDKSLEMLDGKLNSLLRDLTAKMNVEWKRPGWDEYFMNIVRVVSARATCDRGRTAVIIVKNKRVLATGYVGSPSGLDHCDDVGHLMHEVVNPDGKISKHCIRTIHAELNAIAQAARYGIPIDGSTLYCKLEPCFTCCKAMINAGIKRVVCEKRYHAGELSREAFKKAGVVLKVLNDEVEKYGNM